MKKFVPFGPAIRGCSAPPVSAPRPIIKLIPIAAGLALVLALPATTAYAQTTSRVGCTAQHAGDADGAGEPRVTAQHAGDADGAGEPRVTAQHAGDADGAGEPRVTAQQAAAVLPCKG